MGEKEGLLLIVECKDWLFCGEKIINFTIIIVKIELGKHHQQMLNLEGDFAWEHDIYIFFSVFLQIS